MKTATTRRRHGRQENMTETAMRKVASLSTEIAKNSERVSRKISRRGRREDRAIIVSSAKYYAALKKLADK